MGEIFISKFTIYEIKAMMKLIPNGVAIWGDDLEEIYSQNEKTSNSKSSH